MGILLRRTRIAVVLLLVCLAVLSECRKKPKKKQVQTRETSIFDFMRLLVVRLVYGFASMMGFGDSLSDFLGGVFVPPGVNSDDYGDYGGEDDY